MTVLWVWKVEMDCRRSGMMIKEVERRVVWNRCRMPWEVVVMGRDVVKGWSLLVKIGEVGKMKRKKGEKLTQVCCRRTGDAVGSGNDGVGFVPCEG